MSIPKTSEDAFGRIIQAVYDGSEAFEIVERDDGHIEAMPAKAYFSQYDDWPKTYQKAIGHAKGRILDVGCGAGRHSLYLQEKGFNVTGIDISPLAVKVCKSRGLKKVRLTSVEKADFKPNTFDTIIMMGNNFGIFANFNKARRLLKKFHKFTSKDALIIADTNDPYKTDNLAHLAYHRRNRQRGRMGGQLKIRIRYKQYKGRWFEYLLVSKKEMEKILKGTGWAIKKFIDSADERQSRYVALIRKIA